MKNLLVCFWVLMIGTAVRGSESGGLLADRYFYPEPMTAAESMIPFDKIQGAYIKDGVYQMPLLSKNWHRASFDFNVHWDLSASNEFKLDLAFSDPQVPGNIALYFQSGNGWYSMPGKQILMKDSSVQRYVFKLDSARTEGEPGPLSEVNKVRLAVYPKSPADFETRFIAIAEDKPSVLILMEDGLFSADSDYIKRFVKMYQSAGIRCRTVRESEASAELLKSFAVVTVPYQEKMKKKTVSLLKEYASNNGFLVLFYSQPNELMNVLGFQIPKYYRMADLGINIGTMKFESGYLNRFGLLLPEEIRQNSHNIQAAFPEKPENLDAFLKKEINRPRIAAWWYDRSGQKTNFPAILESGRGIYVSHVFYSDDFDAKVKFLLAQSLRLSRGLQKNYILSLWQKIFKIGIEPDMISTEKDQNNAEVKTNRLKKNLDLALPLFRQLGWKTDEIAAVLDGNFSTDRFVRYSKLCSDIEKVRQTLSKNYIASVQSRPVEARFWWEHSGAGAYPGDWDRTMRELSEGGFNGVITNMLWGGGAYYKSDYLPAIPAFSQYGDQIAQAVRAGKKYGVEVHVWKVNFNLIRTPKEFIEKMRVEGRLQKSTSGEEKEWLCPSHPKNRELEINSMLEVAKKYEVDGIHFDYIRYDGSNFCFCEGCQKRFSDYYFNKTGKKIGDLAKQVRKDLTLRDEFDQWRADQITAVVRGVRERVDRECPKVKISAAVFRDYPNCKTSVAQNWVRWVHEGYLDFICPMDYTENNEIFAGWLKTQQKEIGGKIPFYPGIGLGSSSSRLESDQVTLQMKMTRDYGAQGFTVFSLNRRSAAEQLQDFKAGPTKGKAVTPHSVKK